MLVVSIVSEQNCQFENIYKIFNFNIKTIKQQIN